MSVNSEKFEIKETQEIPATNGPQRIIALKHFNALYKKLKADGETLGRKDFTIHVDSKFEKYSNKFTYSDVNHKEGETGPQTRIMRISKSQETRELCEQLEAGCNYRILSWKQGKTYIWLAAVKIDRNLNAI